MRYLPEYKSSKNGISVNLYLDKNESVFVVFRSSKKAFNGGKNYPRESEILDIVGTWDVHFKSLNATVDKNCKMNELNSWTEFEDEDIKYFSGTATYKTLFMLKKSIQNRIILI